MTNDKLDKYIKAQSKRKYNPRTNNCVHFICGYHGLKHKVPDLRNGLPDDWRKDVNDAFAQHGIDMTWKKRRGNIVIGDDPKGNTVCALRVDDTTLVALSRHGVTFWKPEFPHCDYAPTKRRA